ncbi:MAG: peroxidase-related enzyme [Acidobacteriaceae bacterium]
MPNLPSNHDLVARLGTRRVAPSSTNLPLVDERTASPEVAALYEQYRERFGRSEVPGILMCFATHPPLLESMMDLAASLLFADGLLLRRHKEMIATLISSQNECPYCADSHGSFLREMEASDDLLCALRTSATDSASLSPAEQALLRFALQVNDVAQSITRTDVENMMRAGWTEAQVAEAVHVAALFATFNRVANAFGLPSPYPGTL